LLSVPGKVFTCLLLNGSQDAIDTLCKKGKEASRKDVLAWKILLEYIRDLMVHFIDFKKTFDGVHRAALLKILKYYGIFYTYKILLISSLNGCLQIFSYSIIL